MQKSSKKLLASLGRFVSVALLPVMLLSPAYALDLQEILKKSLVEDPSLREAKANEGSAHNAMKATQGGHYPVISLTGTQVLAQKHKFESNKLSDGPTPGVRGTLNLYAWGGIEASVRRDKGKERYFHHKYYETQEELGSTIGKLYLTALRARDALEITQIDHNRHSKMLGDLNIIVKYDGGRRSELVQARSRQLQVETNIVQLRRTMEVALSRLAKYTDRTIRAEELTDPFSRVSAIDIVNRFKSPDKAVHPTYMAQMAEKESARAMVDVSKAARMPALNLEGTANRDNKELYLSMSWNVLDQAARYSVKQNAEALIAAESKLDQILREVAERARTAEVDMAQSERQIEVTSEHIASQKEVIKAYELQFKIARRTLIDVLDSYSELSNIELANITARNDFRDAALEYLVAQSQVAQWAGVAE